MASLTVASPPSRVSIKHSKGHRRGIFRLSEYYKLMRLRSEVPARKSLVTLAAVGLKEFEGKRENVLEVGENRPLKVGIICGGPSAERGISLNSARSVLDHIQVTLLFLHCLNYSCKKNSSITLDYR